MTPLSLDLTGLDESQRIVAWRDWLRASFPEYSLESISSAPDGNARVLTLGDARLWRVEFPAQMTIRAEPAVPFKRDAFVNFQLRGTRTVQRDGRVFHVEPGDLSVGRAATHGVETTYSEGARVLLLELPSRHVVIRHPQVESWDFHLLRSDAPGGALLRRLLETTLELGDRFDSHERRVALASIIELLVLPMVGLRSKDMHVPRVESALRLIDERIADTHLSADMLASEQGISRRRLDEVFVGTLGCSVSATILQRRLQRATQLLGDPTYLDVKVASIARNVGFRDASHFARAFKARYGITPKRWRMGAGGES